MSEPVSRGDSGKPQRCLGMIGLLFGHKFMKSRGGYTYPSDTCWRCGLRSEGPS